MFFLVTVTAKMGNEDSKSNVLYRKKSKQLLKSK